MDLNNLDASTALDFEVITGEFRFVIIVWHRNECAFAASEDSTCADGTSGLVF